MYAFKVSVNDQAPVVGGASDLGVLSAILSGTGNLGSDCVRQGDVTTADFSFRLGGLTSRPVGQGDEHLHWLDVDDLKPGDRLTIEIVKTDSPDLVIGGSQAKQRDHDEREYFEHCKRAYFEMRSKYEGDGKPVLRMIGASRTSQFGQQPSVARGCFLAA